ncbi:DUF177 domain-containing protein [Thermodesulfobacteriota bacterium]
MIVDLKKVPFGSQKFDFSLEKEWWRSSEKDEQVVGLDEPLKAKVEIYKAGERYVLEGSISGGLQIKCDRCLGEFHTDLKHDFRVFLIAPDPEANKIEVELLEEDMEVGFIDGENIDLGEIIREQVYLSLPLKTLCNDKCLGICPECGNNLNGKTCNCETRQGHPGFSRLKNLKIKGE